jgi:hypothetical protein
MIGLWQNIDMHGETLPLVGLEPTVSRLEGGRDDQFRQRGTNFFGWSPYKKDFARRESNPLQLDGNQLFYR